MLKKPDATKSGSSTGSKWSDPDFAKMFPCLSEYLTATRWADNSPRMTATVTMYFDGSSMVLVVNDRDNERSAFFSESTFTGLLDCVEKALSEDTAEWRSRRRSTGDPNKIPF